MSGSRVSLTRPKRSASSPSFSSTNRTPAQDRGGSTPSIEGGTTPGCPVEPKDRKQLLLEQIKQLPAEEREEFLALLSLDVKSTSTQDRDADLWSSAVHTALQNALGSTLSGSAASPLVVHRTVATREILVGLRGFIKRAGLEREQVTARFAVYRLLADLAVNRASEVAKATGAPMSPKLIANCATNMAGLFDAAFPGYLRSGLASVVVNRLCNA